MGASRHAAVRIPAHNDEGAGLQEGKEVGLEAELKRRWRGECVMTSWKGILIYRLLDAISVFRGWKSGFRYVCYLFEAAKWVRGSRRPGLGS